MLTNKEQWQVNHYTGLSHVPCHCLHYHNNNGQPIITLAWVMWTPIVCTTIGKNGQPIITLAWYMLWPPIVYTSHDNNGQPIICTGLSHELPLFALLMATICIQSLHWLESCDLPLFTLPMATMLSHSLRWLWIMWPAISCTTHGNATQYSSNRHELVLFIQAHNQTFFNIISTLLMSS